MLDRPRGPRYAGATLADTILVYPCDALGFAGEDAFYRGIDVPVPFDVLYGALEACGTGGRGAVVGRRFFTLYRIVGYVRNGHITGGLRRAIPSWLAGDYVVSYGVRPVAGGSRLAVKVIVRYPAGPWGTALKRIVPPLDALLTALRLRRVARAAVRGNVRASERTPGRT